MPTFTNNTDANIKAVDISGNSILVAPTESFQTYSYDVDANLTKTSDSPLWNRIKNRQTITATEDGAIATINVKTKSVIIEKISNSVSIYIQDITNTPPEMSNKTSDDAIIIIPANGNFTQLIVTGSGTCDVVEYT